MKAPHDFDRSPADHPVRAPTEEPAQGPPGSIRPGGGSNGGSGGGSGDGARSGSEPGAAGSVGARPSLRAMLASYDEEVQEGLRAVRAAGTGTETVRVLHNRLRQSIAVHDGVLESVLCRLLDELPGGTEVADRLRSGARRRARLLGRFDELSRNVAVHNVYPVSGDEIEDILDELDTSFAQHSYDETTRVGDLLEAAAQSTDPEVVAARMAVEARRTPTRVHAAVLEHPASAFRKRLYRFRDRASDWVDTHHGWKDPGDVPKSPRALQVEELKRQALMSPPSVHRLLAAHDAVVEGEIDALRRAAPGRERADAVHRLSAAVALHDSVVAGVLCPLLETVDGGEALAGALRRGSLRRFELQRRLRRQARGASWRQDGGSRRAELDTTLEALIESFHGHTTEETPRVCSVLGRLPGEVYRTRLSLFEDSLWPWYSQGPSLLAVHMALWAESAPTRAHPLLVHHPRRRLLRSLYHVVDHFRDYWNDSSLERWVFPGLPSRPFAGMSPPPAGRDAEEAPSPGGSAPDGP